MCRLFVLGFVCLFYLLLPPTKVQLLQLSYVMSAVSQSPAYSHLHTLLCLPAPAPPAKTATGADMATATGEEKHLEGKALVVYVWFILLSPPCRK